MASATETYPITGIPLVEGEPIPARQEITSWYANKSNAYQVSLFMRAMTKFQKMPIEERTSYFQVAGIHSYPLVDWDGEKAVKTPEKETDPEPGFCNHNRVTFPTWHRPYMLLFEQALYDNMLIIIGDWKKQGAFSTEETQWETAASKFRLPYWDWARKQQYTGNFGLPQVFTMDYVDVAAPGGKSDSVPNPLIRFRNPSGKPMGDASMGDNKIKDDETMPWSKCIGTSRFGIDTDKPESEWIEGVNDWQKANEALIDPIRNQGINGNLAELVGRILAPGVFNCWEAFASTIYTNEKRQPANAEFLSLEYIHNIIHNTTGGIYMNKKDTAPSKNGYKGIGLGHMCDVPVAAFDPIFWFHHCNIDRFAAIWQELNENLWFNMPDPNVDPTPDSALRPFHFNKTSGPWTSDKCRYRKDLHYDYDDLVPAVGLDLNKPEDKEKYLADLRAHVAELYPDTAKVVQSVPGYVSESNKFSDYVINVVYDRMALNGRAYTILFFLGDAPDSLNGSNESSNYVGMVYTFSSPSGSCGNCSKQEKEKVLSKAQIPLTLPLLRTIAPPTEVGAEPSPVPNTYLSASGLDHERIGLFLGQTLQWKFVELGGTERPAEDFPDTVVAVMHGTGRVYDKKSWEQEEGVSRSYGGYKKLVTATKDSFLGLGHEGTTKGLIHDDLE